MAGTGSCVDTSYKGTECSDQFRCPHTYRCGTSPNPFGVRKPTLELGESCEPSTVGTLPRYLVRSYSESTGQAIVVPTPSSTVQIKRECQPAVAENRYSLPANVITSRCVWGALVPL